MSHKWPVFAMILALLALPVGGLADHHEKPSHDHHKRKHHVITLDSANLHPSTVTMSPDDVLLWVNYSGKTVHLKLPRDEFDKWTCAARVNFGIISENEVLSPPIGALEYSPPCLKNIRSNPTRSTCEI